MFWMCLPFVMLTAVFLSLDPSPVGHSSNGRDCWPCRLGACLLALAQCSVQPTVPTTGPVVTTLLGTTGPVISMNSRYASWSFQSNYTNGVTWYTKWNTTSAGAGVAAPLVPT